MAKIIKFDTEARSKMLKGINTLANVLTPFSIPDLASVSNLIIFAILFSSKCYFLPFEIPIMSDSFIMLYSLPSILTSVPDHLPKRTTSPTLTSISEIFPSSFLDPGPTATTSPYCGLPLAESGIIIPLAVFSSLSNTLISTRSCKGLNFIYIFSYKFLCMADMVCFVKISRG